MKNLMKNLTSYFLMPALAAGFYFTQHNAFLFFMGAISAFATVILTITVVVVWLMLARDSQGLRRDVGLIEAVYAFKTQSQIKKFIAYSISLGLIIFLAYSSAYVTLSIYLIPVILSIFIAAFLETLAKEIEKICTAENITVKELLEALKEEKLKTESMSDAQKILRELQIERLREKSR